MSYDLTTIGFFSGVGGMSKGLKLAGFKNVYSSDNWDVAGQFYINNLPENNGLDIGDYRTSQGHYQFGEAEGDIYNINFESVNKFLKRFKVKLKRGEIALINSGSVCHNLSKINPNRYPFADSNYYMFNQFDMVDEFMPAGALFEQVDGMFDNKVNPFVSELMRHYAHTLKHNYHMEVQIMNAKNYGGRQDRKRTIFMLVRKDVGVPSFPPPCAVKPEQFMNNLLPNITHYNTGKNWKSTKDIVAGTLTANGRIKVIDGTTFEERKMKLEEYQVISNLEGCNFDGISLTNSIKLMGNMVQIPFMAALGNHMRTEILKC
ncbi:DNA cytosine methyltransferase [Limnovirga soli]|uniref:DNA (cytosine-5-)-methyltransferase n=1 Tax=Limnovirga soli TaxID=2656915 RepID=A0A8J8FFK9_9BACT|nr:DNA cytosine methyltransferase [Limnovirga soli]NNV57206.1 hypothetical protein [Limnovirga soli]